MAPSSRVQLGVAARRGRLALERAHLAVHLAQEVLHPGQARFARVEPALGPLASTPVLEDPGGLFDDRSAVLGARLEDACRAGPGRR